MVPWKITVPKVSKVFRQGTELPQWCLAGDFPTLSLQLFIRISVHRCFLDPWMVIVSVRIKSLTKKKLYSFCLVKTRLSGKDKTFLETRIVISSSEKKKRTYGKLNILIIVVICCFVVLLNKRFTKINSIWSKHVRDCLQIWLMILSEFKQIS